MLKIRGLFGGFDDHINIHRKQRWAVQTEMTNFIRGDVTRLDEGNDNTQGKIPGYLFRCLLEKLTFDDPSNLQEW